MNRLFRRLQALPFRPGADPTIAFVDRLAEFLAELNAVHPFPEGNGRTQLTFLHLIALRVGHPLS